MYCPVPAAQLHIHKLIFLTFHNIPQIFRKHSSHVFRPFRCLMDRPGKAHARTKRSTAAPRGPGILLNGKRTKSKNKPGTPTGILAGNGSRWGLLSDLGGAPSLAGGHPGCETRSRPRVGPAGSGTLPLWRCSDPAGLSTPTAVFPQDGRGPDTVSAFHGGGGVCFHRQGGKPNEPRAPMTDTGRECNQTNQ